MDKNIIILFCVVLLSTEINGTFELIGEFIDKIDAKIIRVRTLEEFYARANEFVLLDFIGLVEQYNGYTAEEYDVQTKDGYILKLHRISGSPSSPKALGKPVVYFQHGLLGNSDYHVFMGPEHSFAFLLADAGYDVWFGNLRGTTYSKKHILYSSKTNNQSFWNFSMDEMGTIDVAKFIDVVLEKTNKQQLTYIGFSMGTTLSYILLSTKPEYNDKINLVINISPVAYFTPPFGMVVKALKLAAPTIKTFALTYKIYQILPQSKLLHIIGKDICTTDWGKILCGTILHTVLNINNLNATALPTVFSYASAGTSLKTLDHFYQLILSGKLQKYDYGIIGNRQMYNSATPPEYDLTKITAPQAIFYADNDAFVNVRDAEKIKNKLKNVVAFEKVPVKGFNHLDFVWGISARTVVHYNILKLVKLFA